MLLDGTRRSRLRPLRLPAEVGEEAKAREDRAIATTGIEAVVPLPIPATVAGLPGPCVMSLTSVNVGITDMVRPMLSFCLLLLLLCYRLLLPLLKVVL